MCRGAEPGHRDARPSYQWVVRGQEAAEALRNREGEERPRWAEQSAKGGCTKTTAGL